MGSRSVWLRYVCLAAAAALLSSCGGGGGGDGGTGGGNAGGGGASSLIPTAPAPGAVLFTNADALRPMRAGAQWNYHGVNTPDGGPVTGYYVATVTQQAAASGVVESNNNVLVGGTTQAIVSLAGGAVHVQDDLLGSGTTNDYIELRSPVRVNDQYTQLAQSSVGLGIDIDGDGLADVADVGVYSRVIGIEPVTLRELSRTVDAVRVDMTAVVRGIQSSNGSALPVTSAVQSSWYVEGVGIVRRTLTAGSTSGTGPVEYDERLFSWDGVTEGLGAMGPIPARVPDGVSPIPGLLLAHPLAAAVVGNQAIIVADTLRVADPTSLTLGIVDSRGTLQSVREYPGMLVAPANASPRIHGLDGATALLAMPVASTTLFGLNDLRMQRFDATGGLVSGATDITLGALSDIGSAWDGQALWLLWRGQNELLLQPYGADGSPLAAAQVVDTQAAGQSISLHRMVASNGRSLMTWTRNDFGTAVYRYAVVQGVNSTADVRTLGTGVATSAGEPVQPVLGSNVAALQWNAPIFSQTATGPWQDSLARGVTLDASWNPVRSSSGSLDGELLPSAWTGAAQPVLTGALGDRIVVASFASQLQIPELFSPSDFVLGSFVQPGAAALATSAAASGIALSNESGTGTNIDQFGRPRWLLQWQDRALVIGDNSNRTMISLFWLH